MKRSTAITLILLTLLLCAAVFTDAIPMLRGPAPETPLWYWPYRLRPFDRWWWPLLAAFSMALSLLWLLRSPASDPDDKQNQPLVAPLLLLMTCHLLLQLGFVYADATRTWLPAHEAVLAELIDRTLPPLTSGYFWDAALLSVDEMPTVLANFPARMATFESEHTRTHPPGLLLLNWLTLRAAESTPTLNAPLAAAATSLRCTDLWLIDSRSNVPAALIFWAYLPLLAATASLPAAYLLAKALRLPAAARRLSVALVATLPSLLVFAPKADQLFVPLALLLFAGAIGAARAAKVAPWLPIGVLLGGMVFLSIGNAALGLPVGLLILSRGWRRSTLPQLTALGIGVLLPWLAFWFAYGPAPWEIIGAGLDQHYELVTTERPYAVWTLWNLIDVLTYAGPIVLIGFLLATVRAGVTMRSNWTLNSALTLSLLLLLVLLDLSGSARGEVGRIWLFLFALMAVVAASRLRGAQTQNRLVALLPLCLAVAIGLSWRAVRPVIVVTAPPEMAAFTPGVAHAQALNDEIVLAGSRISAETNTLTADLLWQSNGAADYPYTAFVHVVNSGGELVAQRDQWPVNGQWPATCWRAGDAVYDPYHIDISMLPSGSYDIFSGMYHRNTLERVGDAVKIGSFSR